MSEDLSGEFMLLVTMGKIMEELEKHGYDVDHLKNISRKEPCKSEFDNVLLTLIADYNKNGSIDNTVFLVDSFISNCQGRQ